MENLRKSSKALHISLWVAQVFLALVLIWAGVMKIFQPVEKVAAMWPWAGQVPVALLKFTGIVDLAGAFGLILPSLLRTKPRLTPIAAIAIIVLMVCAGVFHIVRGEASVIGLNIFFAVVSAFIAWGRFTKATILEK